MAISGPKREGNGEQGACIFTNCWDSVAFVQMVLKYTWEGVLFQFDLLKYREQQRTMFPDGFASSQSGKEESLLDEQTQVVAKFRLKKSAIKTEFAHVRLN